MNWIKLTGKKRPLYVNLDRVVCIARYDDETHLICDLRGAGEQDGTIVVKETVEEILQCMREWAP